MALANISSPTISSENIESFHIDKTNFEEYDLLKSNLDDIFERSNKIVEKYNTKEVKEIIISLESNDQSSFKKMTNDYDLLINTRKPIDVAAGRDDDPDRRREMTELQKNILKSIKITNYSAIEKRKQEQMQRKVLLLYRKVEKSKLKQQMKKEKEMFGWKFIKIIGIYAVPTGLAIGVSILLINSITNPVYWIAIGKKMLGNKLLFYTFLDFMSTFGVFDFNEKLNLRKMYDEMTMLNKSKTNTPDYEDYIDKIMNIAFEQIPDTDYNNKYGATDQLNRNDIYKFFDYMYKSAKRKNIFDVRFSMETNESFSAYVYNLYNSPLGAATLTYLRVGMPVIGYISSSMEILQKYQNVNNTIFLKGLVNPIINSDSFRYYNNYFSASAVNKGSQLIKFIQDYSTGNEYDGNFYFSDGVAGFLIGTLQSVTSIQINTSVNGFFEKIEKEMKEKLPEKTQESIILSIEQEITERAEYKKRGLSNEEIANLIDPPLENASDYKSFIGRFMEKFYYKFKDFSSDPSKYFLALSTTISMYSSLQALVFPGILLGTSEALQGFILTGGLHFNLLKLIGIEARSFSTLDLIIDLFRTFFGGDEAIKLKLSQFKMKLASDIIYDLNILATKLKSIFFNSKTGISINKYIQNITDTTLGSLFVTSCDIVYQIIAIPEMTKRLNNYIPLQYNEDVIKMIQDKNQVTRFAAFLNYKTSNIIQNLKGLKMKEIFSELSEFADINKVLFDNVLPYLDVNKYYSVRDFNIDNFAGNLVKVVVPANILAGIPLEKEYNLIVINTKNDPDPNKVGEKNIELYDTDYLSDLLDNEAKKKITNKDLYNKSIFKQNPSSTFEIYYSYYYTEFLKTKDPNYIFNGGDFKKYLLDIYYAKDIELNDPNKTASFEDKLSYGIIRGVLKIYDEKEFNIYKFTGSQFKSLIKYTTRELIPTNIKNGLKKIWGAKRAYDYIQTSEDIVSVVDYSPVLKGKKDKMENGKNSLVDSDTMQDEDVQLCKDLLEAKLEVDRSKIIEKKEEQLYADNADIDILIPHKYGFSLESMSLSSFVEIRKIMKLVLLNEELEAPIDKLKKLEDISLTNNNLKLDLRSLNRKYTKTFLEIQKRIKRSNNDFTSKFTSPKDNIDLKFLDFDYEELIKFSEEFLGTKKTSEIINALSLTYVKSISGITKKCEINGVVEFILGADEKEHADKCTLLDVKDSDKKAIIFRPDTIIKLQKDLKTNTGLSAVKKNIEELHSNLFELVEKSLDNQIKGINFNLQKLFVGTLANKDEIDKLKVQKHSLTDLKTLLGHMSKRSNMNTTASEKLKDTLYSYFEGLSNSFMNNSEYINEKITSYSNLCSDKSLTDEEKSEGLKNMMAEDLFIDEIYFGTPKGKAQSINNGVVISNIGEYIKNMKNSELKTILEKKHDNFKDLLDKMNILKSGFEQQTIDLSCSNKDVEEYIKHIPQWYGLQSDMLELYKKQIAINMYQKMNKNIEAYKNNIDSATKAYLQDLSKLENKYTQKQDLAQFFQMPTFVPSGPSIAPDTPQGPSRNQQSGPALAANREIESTPQDQGQIQQQQQKIEESQAQAEKLQEEQEEALEEGLQEEEKEKVEEKLETGFDLGFGGAADFFSNMVNMLSNLQSTPMSTNAEINLNDEYAADTEENPIKSPLEVCQQFARKWWMAGNVLKTTDVNDKDQCTRCKSENFVYYINSQLTQFIIWANTFLKGLQGAGNILGGLSGGIGYILKTLLVAILTCGKQMLFYFYINVLETIIKDQNEDSSNLGINILILNWIYGMNLLREEDKKGKTPFSAAGLAVAATDYSSNKLCALISGGVDMKQAVNDKYIQFLDKLAPKNSNGDRIDGAIDIETETNINGYINRGQQNSNGVNESDISNLLGLISELQINENNVQILEGKNGDKCKDFTLSVQNLTATDVLVAQIKNYSKGYIMNYILCEVIGQTIPNVPINIYNIRIWIQFGFYAYGSIINGGYINLFKILSEIIAVTLMDDNATGYVLTLLFGNSSQGLNKNYGRDLINKSIENVKNNSKVDGKLDMVLLKQNLFDELGIIGKFFNGVCNTIYTAITNAISQLKKLGQKPTKQQKTTFAELKNYQDFLSECKTGVCSYEKLTNMLLESFDEINNIQENGRDLVVKPSKIDKQSINILKNRITPILNELKNKTKNMQQLGLTFNNENNSVAEDQTRIYLEQFDEILNKVQERLDNKEFEDKQLLQDIKNLSTNDNPIMKYQMNNYNIYQEEPHEEEMSFSEKVIVLEPCKQIDDYAVFFNPDKSNPSSTIRKECVKMENKDIEAEDAKRRNRFKDNYQLFKSSKNSYQNKIQILNEFLSQYRTIVQPLPDGNKKQSIIKKYADFLAYFYTLEDTDPIETYKTILLGLYNDVFDELLTYQLDESAKDLIEKIMIAIDPKNESNVEDFMTDAKNYLINGDDSFQKVDENESELTKKYIVKTISPQTDIDDKVFYYLKLSPDIIDSSELQKRLYFGIENYPSTGIGKVDGFLLNQDFKDALHKKIGFLLTENSISGSQRYKLEDTLKIQLSNGQNAIVNSIDDILIDDKLNIFLNGITAYDKDSIVNKIYSTLSKNGLNLQRQKRGDGTMASFLCNTEKPNFYVVEPYDLKNNDNNIMKLDEHLNDIIRGKEKKERSVNAPPILYNYQAQNTPNIEQAIIETKKILIEVINNAVAGELSLAGDLTTKEWIEKYNKLISELFVKNNYEFSNGIGVLKQDIELYKKTYIDFDFNAFTSKISDSLTDRETKISALIENKPTTTSYTEYFWSWLEYIQKYLSESDYLKFFSYNYGYQFDYFDNLELKGDLNLWYEKGQPKKHITNIADIPSKLNSIIPLSVLYDNVNNRIIKKNQDGTFEITYSFDDVEKI